MSLSAKRELFAQHVASGKSQAEAYRIAYPKSLGWKPDTVWSKASTLMADGKVSERVDAIRSELAARGLWSREQSVKVLSEIASGGEKDADRVRAVAELNKMHGFEAPQRVEHSGDVRVTRVELVPMRAKE